MNPDQRRAAAKLRDTLIRRAFAAGLPPIELHKDWPEDLRAALYRGWPRLCAASSDLTAGRVGLIDDRSGRVAFLRQADAEELLQKLGAATALSALRNPPDVMATALLVISVPGPDHVRSGCCHLLPAIDLSPEGAGHGPN